MKTVTVKFATCQKNSFIALIGISIYDSEWIRKETASCWIDSHVAFLNDSVRTARDHELLPICNIFKKLHHS